MRCFFLWCLAVLVVVVVVVVVVGVFKQRRFSLAGGRVVADAAVD